jgi:hypothetical protein
MARIKVIEKKNNESNLFLETEILSMSEMGNLLGGQKACVCRGSGGLCIIRICNCRKNCPAYWSREEIDDIEY